MSFADNITVEALEADPYPIYAQLRRSAPVAFVPAVNLWFVVWCRARSRSSAAGSSARRRHFT